MNGMTKTTLGLGLLALLALPSAALGQISPDAAEGAEVWASNCVRCHNARPSSERTDLQWTVIVSHMRARANLTRTQARTVTAFLQATNLPPETTAAAPAPAVENASGSGDEATLQVDPETLKRLTAYLAKLLAPTVDAPRR